MWTGMGSDRTVASWDLFPCQTMARPRRVPPFQVGFLKILHKYEITFLLPLLRSPGGELCPLPLPSLNLRLTGITPLPEGKAWAPPWGPLCPPPALGETWRGAWDEGL